MKAIILVNDIGSNPELKNEHGFSVYINYKKHNILFDTGTTDIVLHNMQKLNILPSSIDCIILSHGHYDHTGGLKYLFPHLSQDIKIYASEKLKIPKYKKINNEYKYIGLPSNFSLENLILFKGKIELTEDIILTHLKYKNTPAGYFWIYQDNSYKHDMFEDEIVLVIKKDNGIYIFTGCSHSGIVNIVKSVKEEFVNLPVKAVIGGLHLRDKTESEIIKIGEELNRFNIENYYLYHCTGENAYKILKQKLKAKVIYGNTGDILDF